MLTSPSDIAEAFIDHFTNIGQTLACEIPTVDIDPLFYLNPSLLKGSMSKGGIRK